MIFESIEYGTDGALALKVTVDTDASTVTTIINGGQPQVRALTAAEVLRYAEAVAARQADANRQTIDAAIVQALVELDALIAAPAVDAVPAGTLTTAQLSNVVRAMRDAVQQNRAGAQKAARTLKQTIRLVRGDFSGVG